MISTHRMLLEHDGPLSEIYRDSGLPFYWLVKFRRGLIKDPSVNRVQRLYEFLTKQRLDHV